MQAVDALPVLSAKELISPPEQHRACVVLGQLAHSYIHGGSVPWASADKPGSKAVEDTSGKPAVLPAGVAVPWLQVCGALGLPPVLTAMLDLWNWRRPIGAAFEPSELECISTTTGTSAEVTPHRARLPRNGSERLRNGRS